ncbi:serine hydrolase [Candidatus Woesearchaeota archaeon]|nr:serine hydrolase [Candidatus Woesearchaeota archaeon]
MDPSRRRFLANLGKATALAGIATIVPVPSGIEGLLERVGHLDLSSTAEARQRRKSDYEIIADGYAKTTREHGSADLETQIGHFIGYLRRQGVLPSSEETSFYVYDIEKNHVVADINIDEQRMAASLIKPFVMAAAYEKLSHGGIGNGERQRIKQDIRAMIQQSDNNATNRIIDFVGGVRVVQRYIVKAGLFSKTHILEKIPGDGRTYRNKTSAHDLNILLNQLYHGRLVSREASAEMLDVLRGYQTSRIDQLLLPMPEVKDLAGKTGVVYGMNGESTVVFYENKAGQSRPFIFTAMFEDKTKPHSRHRDESWAKTRSEIIRKVAQLTTAHYQSELVDQYRERQKRLDRVGDRAAFYNQRHDFIASARQRGKAYVGIIQEASKAYTLQWEDLYSILFVESAFQTDARSPTGPRGIAQLTEAAAEDAGLKVNGHIDERLNPHKAIFAAAKILRGHINYFLAQYNNNQFIARDNAIAAYQSGRTGISKCLGNEREVSYWHLDTNTKENKEYVPRVLAVRKIVFGT